MKISREELERALMRLNEYMDGYAIAELTSIIIESEDVIMLRAEMEHDIEHIDNLGSIEYGTWVRFKRMPLEPLWLGSDLRGIPGEYIFIGLPAGEEEKE